MARVEDLRIETLQPWLDDMAASDLSINTLRCRQAVVFSLYNWLVKWCEAADRKSVGDAVSGASASCYWPLTAYIPVRKKAAHDPSAPRMLTPTEHPRSFSDTDQICESRIPPNSVSHQFREVVAPLITDAQFAAMYSPATGRPAIFPSLLACATILQFHRNLSDRERSGPAATTSR